MERTGLSIVFRTDASRAIGSGHVMRCLTLAEALRSVGAGVLFVCRAHEGNLCHAIEARGFRTVQLPIGNQGPASSGVYANWLGATQEQDAVETAAAMQRSGVAKPDWIVVDHYGIGKTWEVAARALCGKILVVDDLADRRHDCDMLLDQNLVSNYETRYDDLLPPATIKLLGPSFALLQPQFEELRSVVHRRSGPVQRMLIYFGSGDRGLSKKTLEAFLSLERSDVGVDLVIGPATQDVEAVRNLARGNVNIAVHETQDSLARFLVEADIAVGACGATSWERLCLLVPAIAVTLADNQRPIAQELERRGQIVWLGDHDAVSRHALSNALSGILAGTMKFQDVGRGDFEVDGRGAARVAAVLGANSATPLVARPACIDDEALLLEWANDPKARSNSFDPSPIEAVTHANWLRTRLIDPSLAQIYIVETDTGIPIGQTRFEFEDGRWTIDYSLAPAFRGRSLAARVLEKGINALRDRVPPGAIVVGRVKPSNGPSNNVFRRLQFCLRSASNSFMEYERRA